MDDEQVKRVREWAQREIAAYEVPLDPILREEVAEVVLWLLEPDPVKVAAPDLLEACEAVVSQYGNDDLTLYEQHAIGLMVKDAIAKAKPIGDE